MRRALLGALVLVAMSSLGCKKKVPNDVVRVAPRGPAHPRSCDHVGDIQDEGSGLTNPTITVTSTKPDNTGVAHVEDGRGRVASDDQIKMVELKVSQGAKPGHGGVLPAAKVSEEISRIRGVAMGRGLCLAGHPPRIFIPLEMMAFIGVMRQLSGGKPAGFKLCIGHPWEFLAICKAMLESGMYPDFIVVHGNEGGTGAAPLEFMDHLGMPMREGVNFVHNALIGINARDRVKIGAAGKIATAFDMARAMAIGADWCN